MSLRQNEIEFFEKWAEPYYMRLKNHSWFKESSQENKPYFVTIVEPALAEISAEEVERLLNTRNWRTILVGSWFAGIKGMSQYTENIGRYLGCGYAQSGICFALACFKNELSVRYLSQYLERFFASKNSDYDYYNFWAYHYLSSAFYALMWINKNATRIERYQKYLEVTDHLPKEHQYRLKLYPDKQLFEIVMNFCKKWFW